MSILFQDIKEANVQLQLVGIQPTLAFKVIARSECYEFTSHARISRNELDSFREDLVSFYNLKKNSTVLSSEERNLVISVCMNEYGHLYFVFKIKNLNCDAESELKLESDLSYLPNIIEQIDEILKGADHGPNKEDEELTDVLASVCITVKNILTNGNYLLQLNINSHSFSIARRLEITKEEKETFIENLNSFYKAKRCFSFFPLGVFTFLSLSWHDGNVWINCSVSDYQYPYNSITINLPCRFQISENIKNIHEPT